MNSINVSYGDDTSIIYLYIKYNDGKYQWTMAFKKQENGDYKTTRQLFDNLIIDYLNVKLKPLMVCVGDVISS
jgi:hypothetical protein